MTAFPFISDEDFRNFVSEITAHQESGPKENHYQYLISEEDAQEIYHYTKLRFQDKPSAAWIYFYETALAEEMLKEFILSVCFAKQAEDSGISGRWKLQSTLDEGMPDEIATIRAGGKNYSVHMVSNSGTAGWGIRKDRLQNFLSVTDKAFQVQGALFCSMKAYPSGAIVVRFENYMERERLEKLLGQKEEVFRNFVRLSFEEVYESGDLREGFLRTAVEDAMGMAKLSLRRLLAIGDEKASQEPVPDMDKDISKLLNEITPYLSKTSKPEVSFAPQMLGAPLRTLGTAQKGILKTRGVKDVKISEPDEWYGILEHPEEETKDMEEFLDALESIPSGRYSCMAGVIFTDMSAGFLTEAAVDVSVLKRKTPDPKDFALIVLGISNISVTHLNGLSVQSASNGTWIQMKSRNPRNRLSGFAISLNITSPNNKGGKDSP